MKKRSSVESRPADKNVEAGQESITATAAERVCTPMLAFAFLGLTACLLRPWTVDRPLHWPGVEGPPPTTAFGSIAAFASQNPLAKNWPFAALAGVLGTGVLWSLVLVLRLSRRKRWSGIRSRVISVMLAVEAVAVAAASVMAIRRIGAHATAALVAMPVPLVAGAVALAIPAVVGGAWRAEVGRARRVRRLLSTIGVASSLAAGTTIFALADTTSWRISATTTRLPAAPDAAAPSRPGRLAWHSRPTRPTVDVEQAGGYTVIGDFDNEGSGGVSGEVRVLDSATGRSRWHYRRADADMHLADVSVSSPQTLVVQTEDLAGHTMLLGFDLASGRRLWASALRGQSAAVAQSLITFGRSPSDVVITVDAPGWSWISLNTAVSVPVRHVTIRAARTGRVLWSEYTPTCDVSAVLPQADTLLLQRECATDKAAARLEAFGLSDGRPRWRSFLPSGIQPVLAERFAPVQVGGNAVAVPTRATNDHGNAAFANWMIYRLSDGQALREERALDGLRLAAGQELSTDAHGVSSLRDALTGHISWTSRSKAGAGGQGDKLGRLDDLVAASGHLYATFSKKVAQPTTLLTFEASSGHPTGASDLTYVSGDHCQPFAGTPLCATQRLYGAGGGVLVIGTCDSYRCTISGLADGGAFVPSR